MNKKQKEINNSIYIEDSTHSNILYTQEFVEELFHEGYKLGFLQGTTYANKIFKSKSTVDLNMEVEKLSVEIEGIANKLKILNDIIINQNKLTNDNLNNLSSRVNDSSKTLMNKIDDLSHRVEGIDKRTIVLKKSLDYIKEDICDNIKSSIKDIKEDTKDLSIIRNNIGNMDEKSKWWKQFLLAPIISATLSGVLVAIIMLCIKSIK